MTSKKGLPIILSPRSVRMRQKKLLEESIEKERDNILFSPKHKAKKKEHRIMMASHSPSSYETRMEFFNSFKNLAKIKKNNEEETVSIAYLSECNKRKLSPIPLGFGRPSTSEMNFNSFGISDNYAAAFGRGIQKVRDLELLNIGRNSLSPKGMQSVISNITTQPLKELNLKGNNIDNRSIKSLLKLFSKNMPSLKYLNLENTRISDIQVCKLCEILYNDRILQHFSLAINSLGIIAAEGIKKMLIENHYLKKLDLHWNSLKDTGALLIFEGLTYNDSLKELDLSWNSIGNNRELNSIKCLSDCLPKSQGLSHLDLSFNYFTINETKMIAEGLKNNHDLLGLHYLGNEGFLDSQGFLIASKNDNIEDSHLFFRILEDYKSKIKAMPKIENIKCWICEDWVEITVNWYPSVSGGSNNGQMFIHFESDNYEPDLMNFSNDHFEISRVMPAGEVKFFYSKADCVLRSKEYETIDLEKPLQITSHFSEDHISSMTVFTIHKIDAHGNRCNYERPPMTQPRKLKFNFKPPDQKFERLEWGIPKSLFKDYKFLDDKYADDCFEFDWNQSKITNFVKLYDQEALKSILRNSYMQIIETFRYLASLSGNEYLTIGSNIFTDFLNQNGIYDDLYEPSDLGVNWNAVIVPKEKKQPFNPGNSLVRYEFLELLVRIANDKYVRNKVCQTNSQAFTMFIKDHLKTGLAAHDSSIWRKTEYLNEEVDIVLKAHKPILDAVFKIYSGRKALPGQKAFMCLEEFRQLCIDGNLIPQKVPAREIDTCFGISMMIQIDELSQKRHVEMSFVEFIEALCRVCSYLEIKKPKEETLSLDESLSSDDVPELSEKVKKAMWNLYQLCPRQIRDNFVLPTQQTYKTFMYKFDRKPTIIRDMYRGLDDL